MTTVDNNRQATASFPLELVFPEGELLQWLRHRGVRVIHLPTRHSPTTTKSLSDLLGGMAVDPDVEINRKLYGAPRFYHGTRANRIFIDDPDGGDCREYFMGVDLAYGPDYHIKTMIPVLTNIPPSDTHSQSKEPDMPCAYTRNEVHFFHRRLRRAIRIITVTAVLACLMIILFTVTGCGEQGVRREQEQNEQQIQQLEHERQVYLATLEVEAIEAVSDLNARAEELQAERESLAEQRLEAAAADTGWMNLLELGAGLIGGGAGIGVMGAVRAGRKIRDATVKGEQIGAGVVRDSIAAGRKVDPEFDKFFSEGSTAGSVMRVVLAATPNIEAIVKEAGKHKPPK